VESLGGLLGLTLVLLKTFLSAVAATRSDFGLFVGVSFCGGHGALLPTGVLAMHGWKEMMFPDWGAYPRHLDPDVHSPGKRNTQKIECTHLVLRTRIKRLLLQTLCFSKSIQMHDMVMGVCVNRYAVR
jgi:IS1 transposase